MQETKYALQEGRLIIRDKELGIAIDEPFQPLLIPTEGMHGQFIEKETIFLRGQNDYSLQKSGVRVGEYKIVYPDGKLKHRAYYLEGKLHGPSTFYSPNGRETASAWFYKGRREGLCLWHYLSGALNSRQRFLHGVWEGLQEYYYADGKKKTELIFQKGNLRKAKLYKPDGSLLREIA